MVIEIFADDTLAWTGDFAVAAESGPYAHQVGSFEGSVSGGIINATCETVDGYEFQLTGTVKNHANLELTRSDIPGTVLDFKAVQPNQTVARGETSFNLNTGTNGRVTLSDTPYSTQANGTMFEYRGKWQGLNVTFWSYSSGYATLVIYGNDYAVTSTSFRNYKLSDFATSSQTSVSSHTSTYSPITKAQVKFKGSADVSP